MAIAAADVQAWVQEDQVGIYKELRHNGVLFSLIDEKDFAWLDETGQGQFETFVNPHQAGIC